MGRENTRTRDHVTSKESFAIAKGQLPISDVQFRSHRRGEKHILKIGLTGFGDGTVDDRSIITGLRTASWAIGNWKLAMFSLFGALFRDANRSIAYQQFHDRASRSRLSSDSTGGKAKVFALH